MKNLLALRHGDVVRRVVVALALVVLLAPSLAAQGTPRRSDNGWRAPRAIKWTLLAASIGLGYWAYTQSHDADRAYDDLRKLCEDQPDRCALEGQGYADAHAEALYDASNAGDRKARLGLLIGQSTLLGSAAFFIIDLRHGGQPDNIPYDPPPAPPPPAQLRVGIRIPLR